MSVKIDQPIVSVSISHEKNDKGKAGFVQSVPNRPHTVEGKTYKVEAAGAYSASIYVTINDIQTPYGKRPIEVFIMSRVQESYQWITLVTRLASAVFRQQALQPDYNTFVVQEFLSTFDPGEQYWSSHYKGRFMNSVVQEIGMLMQDHLAGLGLMDPVKRKEIPDPSPPDAPETLPEAPEKAKGMMPDNEEEIIVEPPPGPTLEDNGYTGQDVSDAAEATEVFEEDELERAAKYAPQYGAPCPDCQGHNLHNMEGCLTCVDCGWSKCA